MKTIVDESNSGVMGRDCTFKAHIPKINGSKLILKNTDIRPSHTLGEANTFRKNANIYFRSVKKMKVLQATRRGNTFNLSCFFLI